MQHRLPLTLILLALGSPQLMAQTLPSGFVDELMIGGLTEPTAFTVLPDGRVLIAEKQGIVRVLKNGALLSTPFIDLRTRVNAYWDRGLLGILADREFASNGYVYLYYVYESDAANFTGTKTARLTRVTASGDTASQEVVLLGNTAATSCAALPAGADCIPADSPAHNGGGLRMRADGTLFLSTGDGAAFNAVDSRALRAQDLTSLAGKLLRVTRTGAGVSDNPFWTGSATANQSKVWAYGFRNAFRLTLHPSNEAPYVGDVGWSNWEEVNVALPGRNFGWPCYEGPERQGGYEPLQGCQDLYALGTSAVYQGTISYSSQGSSVSVVGGSFYEASAYPSAYRGAYFFADYSQGTVNYVHLDANHLPLGQVSIFATGVSGPVDIRPGAMGDLHYVSFTSGQLRRIRYQGTSTTSPHLSDRAWSSASNGWGPVERDRSNGEEAGGDGGPITLNGTVYSRGLGVHAASQIRYPLDGACTTFTSFVGVDDEVGSNGSVVFQVWADGSRLYDSGVMRGTSATKSLSVDLTGRQELMLVVTDAGDGIAYDHADWADPQIACGGGSTALFGPPSAYTAGTNTHGVTASDLTGDGRLDLAAANAGSSTVSVFTGNSNGTFGPAQSYTTGRAPKSVLAADLNADGRPDLVTANQDDGTISVLLARSSGGFAAAAAYTACPGAHEAAVADFNGDGRPDAIVACWGGSTVGVLLGSGTGTFGTVRTVTVGQAPHSVVTADFNRDGRQDAAVANRDSGSISLLRGQGDGTFAAAVQYPVGPGAHSIRARDLNGDGFVDLATANDGGDTASVLLGNGDGTFRAAVHYATGRVPKGIGIGDVNGDGYADLVTANTAGNYPTCCNPGGDTVSILLGRGDGTFGAPTSQLVGTTPFGVSLADLNGDGRLDLATANWHSSDVTVLLNTGGSGGADTTAPAISGLAAQPTATSATITWTTNEPASSQVEYGLTTTLGSLSPLSSTLQTAHTVTLSGLASGTTYYYRARSADASGNTATSATATFATTSGGTGTSSYLSDQAWTSMTNAWGPAERDRSNGEQGASDGNTITLNAQTYAKGLGVHAGSEIRYALGGTCTAFAADIGIDDEVGTNGSVVFEVWADGVRLFQSGVMRGSTATQPVQVDITGRNELVLRVTDAGDGIGYDHADWASARVTCGTVSNTAPAATIDQPDPAFRFKVGDVIQYSGSAQDAEDGTVPPERLAWNIVLQHCPGGSCHAHPLQSTTGSSGSFTVPDHGDESYFEIVLTATDTQGLTGRATRDVLPLTATVTLDTSPSGLQVVYNGVTGTAPITRTPILGSTITISAPASQNGLDFVSWSDGGARQHDITVSGDAVYTATYQASAGGDTTAPVISSVTVQPAATGATVAWTTDEAADSQVEYGLTTTLGTTSPLNTTLQTTHSVALSGLSSGTTYYYRVRSADAAGNVALSTTSSFTTSSATSNTVYLSDRTWAAMTNGWGPAERDRSNGEDGSADGGVITLNGKTYAKGLGVHAQSEIRYSLGGTCSAFAAEIGVDDEVGAAGSVTFEVWADGARLYQSAVLTGASATVAVQLDITGRNELVLRVNDGGNGAAYDHGDWAAARVTCESATSGTTYLSDRTWSSMTNAWGPAERDRSNGEQGTNDGTVITLNGQTYAKGLGVHAASEIRFALGGTCSAFAADVGVDDEVGTNGSVVFEVWADGVRLYQSGVLTGTSAAQPVQVDVSGRNELVLRVTDGGNGNAHDHADWAAARVTCTASTAAVSPPADPAVFDAEDGATLALAFPRQVLSWTDTEGVRP